MKTETLNLRIPTTQKEMLKEAARAFKMTLTALLVEGAALKIKELAKDGAKPDPIEEAFRELRASKQTHHLSASEKEKIRKFEKAKKRGKLALKTGAEALADAKQFLRQLED